MQLGKWLVTGLLLCRDIMTKVFLKINVFNCVPIYSFRGLIHFYHKRGMDGHGAREVAKRFLF